MRFIDKVLEKFGDVLIDLGKAAMIAGTAALFFEKFYYFTTIGGVLRGSVLIASGLFSFHVVAQRREEVADKNQGTF